MAEDPPWWRCPVVYQVYLKSFPTATVTASATSTGTAQLDHMRRSASTGCGSTLLPLTAADGGYDVADYRPSTRHTARCRRSTRCSRTPRTPAA